MEEDGVACANLVDALQLQGALDVLDRDDVGRIEALDPLVARDIEQHPAREEPADVLDAELGQAVRRAELRQPTRVRQASGRMPRGRLLRRARGPPRRLAQPACRSPPSTVDARDYTEVPGLGVDTHAP